MKTKLLLLVLILFSLHAITAQITEAQIQKIDSLFLDWNQPNHPGGAVGITKNGKTVFSKAFGLASLEYLVPNAPGTIFNTGSVSKQFTAMGIVVLAQQGMLSVDDDIRKHLPELPHFGQTITIRHMLHHTSGLRSLHAMLELAGWRSDDSRSNADLNRFLLKQQDLNFKPGAEYLYCNTGYMLMVNIIEKVTGEKFRDWMIQTVFKPLGMTQTYVEDNYNNIVPNNATSYYGGNGSAFTRAVEYWGYVGSGNMHSTSDDLLRWLDNFTNPQEGWEPHFKMLQTLDNLNDGAENSYAYGVVIGDSKSVKSVGHGGAIGGFRANVITYPEQALSIAVLTNFSRGNPGQKSSAISDVLLEVKNDDAKKMASQSSKTVKLSKKALKKFEGSYWNAKENYSRKMYLKNDTLRYFRSEASESAMVPIGDMTFKMMGVEADVKITFDLGKTERTMHVTIDGGASIVSQGYLPTKPTQDERKSYAGTYYSPELETIYTIAIENDTLTGHHARHGDFKMKRLKKDILEGGWPFSMAKFKRNAAGSIEGIFVSNGRVRNLWFKKQE